MHKIILEVCDENHHSLREPVFIENLHDLPMGVMQAVEDFNEAHDGAITMPLVITARAEDELEMHCDALTRPASPEFGSHHADEARF